MFSPSEMLKLIMLAFKMWSEAWTESFELAQIRSCRLKHHKSPHFTKNWGCWIKVFIRLRKCEIQLGWRLKSGRKHERNPSCSLKFCHVVWNNINHHILLEIKKVFIRLIEDLSIQLFKDVNFN